ncbi:hypothetical protein [Robbsia andropogonis]|uniref:hypothetical protein n=1 Tax=Robbsia andropogonis TaxID=28092 RepID=UPI00209F6B62|nr:hypothetical protein [Robbsia andropogonis]MCP1120122.1 hypothetical protein [Robbsia andropogonis]MCP1130046.1 hypothetical protein [Robbsia andropogonis]
MAENDFLPFATGSAANVLSQSDYAALSALASGFTSGVAKSAAVNKVLRQSSIMSAVLASFIVQNAGTDVIDDGTTATIEANLTAALNALFITPSELLTALANYAAKNGSTANRFSAANAAAATDALNLGQAQSGAIEAAVASGTANAIVLTRTVPVTALTDQMKVRFKAVATNTGAVALNDSGLGAKNLYGQGNVALVGGEIVSGGEYEAIYSSSAGGYQIIAQSASAPEQGAPGQFISHIPTLAQVPVSIGGTPRMSASASAGATTATFTDDSVLVANALTGATYRIPNFSAPLNLAAAAGIGAMDTGTATASSVIAVYAAFNPSIFSTQKAAGATDAAAYAAASGVFAKMEGTAVASAVYSGSNLPPGYTATALIAIIPTYTTAGQFAGFALDGRYVEIVPGVMATGSTTNTSPTLGSTVVPGLPYSARALQVYGVLTTSTSYGGSLAVAARTDSIGYAPFTAPPNSAISFPRTRMYLTTPRTISYAVYSTNSAGALSYSLVLSGYTF